MPVVQYIQRDAPEAAPNVHLSELPVAQMANPQITTQVNPDDFGAQLGDAVAKVGEQAFGEALQSKLNDEIAAKKARDAANQVRYIQSDRQLQDLQLGLVWGQNGALSKMGQDAIGVGDQVQKQFDDGADAIQNTLVGQRQLDEFMVNRAARSEQIQTVVGRHEQEQFGKVAMDESNANVENSTNLAILSSNDPVAVGQNLDNIKTTIANQGTALGWPAAYTQDITDKTVSAAQVRVIDHMLATGQHAQAQMYYDTATQNGISVKDQLTGDDQTKVDNILKLGSNNGQAQQLSQQILDPARGLNRVQADAEADKITNPDVQDKVKEYLRSTFAIRKDQEQDDTQSTLATHKAAVDQILQNAANKLPFPQVLAKAISPADWLALPEAQKDVMLDYAKKTQVGDGTVKTDFPTYYGLLQKAMNDPQTFKDIPLNMNMAKIGEADLKGLADIQMSIKKGNMEQAQKQLQPMQTQMQVLDDTLTQAGIDVKPKPGSDGDKQLALIRQQVGQQVDTLETTTGKKATSADVQKIVDGLIVPGQAGQWLKGLIPGSGVPFFDQPAGIKPAAKIKPGEVTATDKNGNKVVLRNGQWVTP